MKHVLTFALLSVCILVHGQSIRKRYESYIGQDGVVYFFMPKKLVATSSRHEQVVFDMTYNLHRDSVVFNFSFSCKENTPITDASLCNANYEESVKNLRLIFVEKDKSTYTYRYSCSLSYMAVSLLFRDAFSPITLKLVGTGQCTQFTYTPNDWRKENNVMTDILDLIEFQKKS